LNVFLLDVNLLVLPAWTLGCALLLLLGQVEQLLRPRLTYPRLRCHILGGVAFLLFILAFIPLVDAIRYPRFESLPVIWVPIILIGFFAGFAYARWFRPVLFNQQLGDFYQNRDWHGFFLVWLVIYLEWIPYQLMANGFAWPDAGFIMVLALCANSLLAGFFIGRNSWYIHQFHNVSILG